jgi:AcrR family transcriptional regulator
MTRSPAAPRRPEERAESASSLQRRKRALVRGEISRVAWDLFGAEGYEATTVDEIARAAGVSRRTFFRYFASKEDVLIETSDALAEDLLAAFSRRPVHEPPLVAVHRALRPVVEARLADTEQARAIVRLLRESRTLRRAMLERHARMEERLAALMAVRLGTDPRKDSTPALLAFVTRALLDTAFNVWFDQRPDDVGAMIDSLFRKLQAVVSPRRRAPRRLKGRA